MVNPELTKEKHARIPELALPAWLRRHSVVTRSRLAARGIWRSSAESLLQGTGGRGAMGSMMRLLVIAHLAGLAVAMAIVLGVTWLAVAVACDIVPGPGKELHQTTNEIAGKDFSLATAGRLGTLRQLVDGRTFMDILDASAPATTSGRATSTRHKPCAFTHR